MTLANKLIIKSDDCLPTAIFQMCPMSTIWMITLSPLCQINYFPLFFFYVLTSEEDVRQGSVNECKRGLAENKRGAQ